VDRPSDIEFEPVAVGMRQGGRRRVAGRLAVAAPVVGLALVVGLGLLGHLGAESGPGPDPLTAQVAATVAPSAAAPSPGAAAPSPATTPTRDPSARGPFPGGPLVEVTPPPPAIAVRPPTGEDGLIGGLSFGTAWTWRTEPRWQPDGAVAP
jgi:hypothetical protein